MFTKRAEDCAQPQSPGSFASGSEGIARKTGMERGARGRAADNRVPDSAIRYNGISRAGALPVGIAVTPPFADGIAVARACAQNIAMARAGANRIAGPAPGAHDVRRARTRDNQRPGLVVIEHESLTCGVEADAVAGGRVSVTGRSQHLDKEDGNGRRADRQRPLDGRNGHLGEPDQRSGQRREYGRVLNVRARVTGGWRRRAEGVANPTSDTAGRAGTARAIRAAHAESDANSVSTTRRETNGIAAPAAATKSGAGDAFVKRITRTAPGTDAVKRAKRPGTSLTGSGPCPGDLITDRGRITRARTATPGRADASPSVAMAGAAPNRGSRTAESVAVAGAGAGGTGRMSGHLQSETVTAA